MNKSDILAIFIEVAKGIAVLPQSFQNLKLKDSFPNSNDWDDYNQALCQALQDAGFIVGESELDTYYNKNKTIGDLLNHVYSVCGAN